ncbi:hypothetical protein [Aestuariicoccus sp. MJ-SS9]|uniref:hypothetical protein n=1 Tax=Aestuariicoccus sp. MJ-SS9 TaxID=3079855 RepID=UPI002906FA96|nr:hypothetical protein [Aestuariicoccus sp. MJ-SS9]MDU8911249.1 hypothetical protein [Aestuariicoccus sp. MJ-SS9]
MTQRDHEMPFVVGATLDGLAGRFEMILMGQALDQSFADFAFLGFNRMDQGGHPILAPGGRRSGADKGPEESDAKDPIKNAYHNELLKYNRYGSTA